ncbi:NAD-P-binding protein [Mycena leptocephala]|nr:NAD-P-binding protein [Mycena leptocephala]
MSSTTFSVHTTGEQVADAFSREIEGKNVLITGTSIGGIGFETARAVAKYANMVIITGYSAERLQLAEDAIKKEFPAAHIRKLTLDLSSLAAVRTAAAEVNAYPEPLHVLINNAASAWGPFKVTVDNLEHQMATGHIGPFLFTNLLIPKLLAAGTTSYVPRVVFVASVAHAFCDGVDFTTFAQPIPTKYPTIAGAYRETKSANVLTAIELARRAKGKINVYSLNPGLVHTQVFHQDYSKQYWLDAGLIDENGEPNTKIEGLEWKTVPEGASTTLLAAFDPSLSDKSGMYLDDCQDATETVAPHSSDPANAAKLWTLTEEVIGQSFEL